MPSIVTDAAQSIADALAPSPQPPYARWRWGTVEAVNSDGTMDVNIAGASIYGIRAVQSAMVASAGDRVRIMYLGTETVVDAVRATGGAVETIYETSDISVKRCGHQVMVQCHGVSGTANNNVPLANVDMSAYKPSYNASALVCDTQSTTHFARLWVSKDDGKPYLAFAGYNGASTWYGTLTYIF